VQGGDELIVIHAIDTADTYGLIQKVDDVLVAGKSLVGDAHGAGTSSREVMEGQGTKPGTMSKAA
jgi:hypothetical protein